MAAEPDQFETNVVQNSPSDGPYYYLLRYGQNNEEIRFPPDRALQIRGPFEHPLGCKPANWLVIYTSDRLGLHKVQHIGSKPHVEVRLSVPQSVREAADTDVSQEKLLDLLTTAAPEEDDPDGSLKLTRIDAKKREVALDLAAKEQKLLGHVNKNKELAEGFLLNRSHRLEVREQSEAMFRVQNQASAMVERTMVLVEKVQETIGRFAEIEKAAAQKLASPPPPPDYTPVLSSVVTAIRDIGVSAMQRDDRKRPKTDEDTPPVQAALADKPAGSEQQAIGIALAPTEKPSSAARPQPEHAVVAELKALVERAQAERDRLKSELEAERNRQRVSDEVRPGRGNATPRNSLITPTLQRDHVSDRNSDPGYSESAPSSYRTSRDAACPCGSGRRYRRCCLYKDRQAARRTAKAHSHPPGSQLPPTPSPGSQLPPTQPPGSQLPPTQPPGSQLPPTQPPGSQLPPTQPPGSQLPPDRLASAASTPQPQATAPTSQDTLLQSAEPLPGEVRPEVQELLVNILAGKMLTKEDAPIPAPLVAQVKQVEEVLVSPPKMDPETARKLLNDGSTIEAFGAFLFFNPLLRSILLNRRGR